MIVASDNRTPSEPIWLVLTPSADDVEWRSAIRAGVEAAGLVLRDADREVPASTDIPEREVWLTCDCNVVESFGRTPVAALVPRPETAAEAVAEMLGLFPQQSMTQASLLVARAVSLDQRRTRVFTARDITAAGGRPLVLLDGLSVVPPDARTVETPRPAVRAALDAFSGGVPVREQQIVWSERIFRYDQKAARSANQLGELDVTGRPRILIYGPYLALPPGRWRTRVRFLVDAAAASKEFRIDWGSSKDFSSLSISPPHAGVFEAELDHDWHAADVGEIRFWLMEGAFDGILHFLGANVSLVGRPVANAA